MPLSQNGWTANDRTAITTIPVPGGTLPVREGAVAVVFEWLARRFHNEVEHLVWPGCWGYAERPIRGSTTTLSNHASGTAVDFNAPKHPLGKAGTFTPRQVRAIHRIRDDARGVLRWGGDYSGRLDSMHWEINAPAADVHALAHDIQEDDDMPTAKEIADAIRPLIPTARDTAAALAAVPVGSGEDSPGNLGTALYRTQSELMRVADQIANAAELQYAISRGDQQAAKAAIERVRARDIKHPGEPA